MIDKEFLKSRLPFIEAAIAGKEVQGKLGWSDEWESFTSPVVFLDTRSELRLKPEPVRLPFGPTDVWGKVFRAIINPDCWMSTALIKSDGAWLSGVFCSWQELANHYEHSTDGGLTWGQCWKEEQ